MHRRCSGSSSDDFQLDANVEGAKQALLAAINEHSLEKVVRTLVPVDLMAIFELKWAGETIDRSDELRKEICSFVEITFETRKCVQMFVNFPKHNLSKLHRLLRPFTRSKHLLTAERGPIVEAERLEP